MSEPQQQLDPSALSPADLVRLLEASGSEGVTMVEIQSDIAAGCPVNGDGTINLIHYTAWLVSRSDG